MFSRVKNRPYLILAPMEGVGDRPFRKAMAHIGGFDEACTEFIRIHPAAPLPSLARNYDPNELAPIPIAAQIMGSDPQLMAQMTQELVARGAPRIDLNCGCPSKTVTGRGSGSSLLKEPQHLYEVAKAMVDASTVPVTAKLRSGFQDTSLFRENLLAAQESGISFLTLHPRTKVDGYGPPARWDLIAEAKQLLSIPIVGNGDILTVSDAKRMIRETQCDALMIGRGSVMNPWIFHEIRAHYANEASPISWEAMQEFVHIFFGALPQEMKQRNKINKLKQLANYLFRSDEGPRREILTTRYQDEQECLDLLLIKLENYYANLDLVVA